MQLAATAKQGALGLHARSRLDQAGAASEDAVDAVLLGGLLMQFAIHLGRATAAIAEVWPGRGTTRVRR
jgi:hypothetical protein